MKQIEPRDLDPRLEQELGKILELISDLERQPPSDNRNAFIS
ncbi:hypothetical protein COXBURSA334_1870 [Coxiella burnetii Q321]|nr:hypothetical protein COXBURSA334_1870 [Coxiella burnetii Q321]